MRKFILLLSLIILLISCNTNKISSFKKLSNINPLQFPENLFAENNDSLLNIIINLPSVKYCGVNHAHMVDKVVRGIIDSLKNTDAENIFFYRDWIGTNGFNGYGKLIWKQKEKYNQYQLNFENHDKRYGISSILKSESPTSEVLYFYMQNRIDTVISMPKEPELWRSHAADHFIYTSIKGREKCFNVSGLNIMADSLHLKSQLINKLKIPANEYFDMINKIRKLNKR